MSSKKVIYFIIAVISSAAFLWIHGVKGTTQLGNGQDNLAGDAIMATGVGASFPDPEHSNWKVMDPVERLRHADALRAEGKSGEAAHVIETLTELPDGMMYRALCEARELHFAGKVDMSAALLQRAFQSEAEIQGFAPRLQFAYADTLRAVKQYYEAEVMVERLGQHSAPELRAHALELASDIFIEQQLWTDALPPLARAVELIKNMDDGISEAQTYLIRLQAKFSHVIETLNFLEEGLGLRLYKTANKKRFAQQYADAVAGYDQLLKLHESNRGKPIPDITGVDDRKIYDYPIHDIYAAAAQVYRADCLMRLHRYGEASIALLSVAEDPSHPYRAEALRLLGRLALEERGDIAKAESNYAMAIMVLRAMRDQPDQGLDRYAAPGISRAITKPPDSMKVLDDASNVGWSRIEPQHLFNAETCSWYLDYQIMMAHIDRSMCYFMEDKIDMAVHDLDVIPTIDIHDKALTDNRMPSAYLRLCDGYRRGRLFGTKEELAYFNGLSLVRVIIAEVFFETEQWESALAAYADIYTDDSFSHSPDARAYLAFAQASASTYLGRPDEARKLLSDIPRENRPISETVTHWRAVLLLASIDPEQERHHLELGLRECRDPLLRLDFALRLGVLSYNENDNAAAATYFKLVLNEAPPTDYRKTAAEKSLSLVFERSARPGHEETPEKQ